MGLLSSPEQGRFWDEKTGVITDIQQVGQEISLRNLPLRESLMSCEGASGLASAITALVGKLGTSGCCGQPGQFGGNGTGGAGATGEDPIGEFDPEGTPPDGYSTWEEYYDDVCAKATWLINTIQSDLDRMGTIQFVGATLAVIAPALAALLLDPIPGDELFLLAGVLIAIAGYGAGTLSQVKASFADVADNLVCILFNSTGPNSAKTALLTAFRTQLESDTTDPVIVEYGVQLVSLMFSWQGLNQVYEQQSDRTYPAGDCGNCASGGIFEVYGSPANVDGQVTYLGGGRWRWESNTANFNGNWYFNFRVSKSGVPINFRVENVSLSNYTLTDISESGGEKTPGPDTYDAATVPDLEQHLEDQTAIANFYLFSWSSFTMELDVIDLE